MAIKRLHYYDQQFLVEADFTDEQRYHVEMRRRLNRLLHTAGIADALEVNKTGNRAVTVHPGTAVDREGREMILEADRIIDLSNAVLFPPNTAVSITITYAEAESDPSTATGAPGNTRVTEQPAVQAVTGPLPADGPVVLAAFTLDATGNVPGAIGGLLSAGRVLVGPRGATGPATIDGVANPSGNIDLVPAQAIVITPDDTNNRITIGENHSARTDNPHATTAAQIGALAASAYDLGQRTTATIAFAEADANGANRSVNLGFRPRLVLVTGTVSAAFGGRTYGGTFSGVAVIDAGGTVAQQSSGFGMTRISNTDWFSRAIEGVGICRTVFFNSEAAPAQAENLSVAISSVTATGLTATLTRALANPGNVQLPDFALSLNLLCFG
jgi:hypothetical protein